MSLGNLIITRRNLDYSKLCGWQWSQTDLSHINTVKRIFCLAVQKIFFKDVMTRQFSGILGKAEIEDCRIF